MTVVLERSAEPAGREADGHTAKLARELDAFLDARPRRIERAAEAAPPAPQGWKRWLFGWRARG